MTERREEARRPGFRVLDIRSLGLMQDLGGGSHDVVWLPCVDFSIFFYIFLFFEIRKIDDVSLSL